MAVRIISAFVAIALGIVIFVIDYLPLYIVVLTGLSLAGVYELILATGYIRNKYISSISLFFVCFAPTMFSVEYFRENMAPYCFVFITGLFAIMLRMHETVSFEQLSFIAVISICIPLSFSSFLFMRESSAEHGRFAMLYSMIAAWFTDSGAYFAGTFLGKHQMSKKISPKKTWEGFFGGIVIAGIASVVTGIVYVWLNISKYGEPTVYVDIPLLAVTGVICSCLSVLGDLSASLIKRQCCVKDFGNIMPGHGGVLDRFDSILFVAPFVYNLFRIFPPIRVI
jgi:phosphatidate cytidylyltransferase